MATTKPARPRNFVDDWDAAATPRPPTTIANPMRDIQPDPAALKPRSIGARFTRARIEDLVGAPAVEYGFWGGIDLSRDGDVAFSWNRTGNFEIYTTPLAGARIYQLTEGTERSVWPRWSPDGRAVAFLRDTGGDERFGLWLVDRDGTRERELARDAKVARREHAWSPDGAWIVCSTNRDGTYHLEVIEVATGATRMLTSGTRDDAFPSWSPDGRWIVFQSARDERVRTNIDLYVIPASGGDARRLDTRGGADGESSSARVSPDGRWLAFATDMRGHKEIAIAPFSDGAIGPVQIATRLAYDADEPAWRTDDRGLLYLVSHDSEQSVHRLFTASRADTPVADLPGVHRSVHTASGRVGANTFAFTFSSARRPWDVWARDDDITAARPLTDSLDGKIDPETLVEPVHVWYPSSDGRRIPALLYVPYAEAVRTGTLPPAIVHIHGGPTSQHLRWWDYGSQWFANNGYVVLAPNIRGSTGYGREFQEANRGDWGGADLADVMAGVNWLEREEIADGARIGAYGGSYGGYMTLMALAKEPDRWAAGVSVVGVVDWRTMHGTTRGDLREYLERELGDPAAVPDRYRDRSPITHVGSIVAPLLILQGANDPRVPLSEAEAVVKALRDGGKTHDYHLYPDEGHGFRRTENKIDSMRRAVAWFDLHLKTGVGETPRRSRAHGTQLDGRA
ncbi:MAG: alpha/beta fold hydrolase [Chloroflexi bacterium]|nr:alpha/beta fold hydrolase [Chloroflexota bacterium]